MAQLKFYYNNISQPCRALFIFLNINRIPYEPKILNMAAGEHFEENFSELNPFNKVPVIVDNDFILTESVAILRYLCREKEVSSHWYPKDSKQRARVDEYLEWQHNETRAKCAMYFRIAVLEPMLTGVQPDKNKLNNFKKRMIEACDNMNDIWLKDGKQYLAGDHITIADLLGSAELEQLKMTDYNPCDGRPALARWMARVRATTNPVYDQANAQIDKLANKIKNEKVTINMLAKF